MPSYTESDQQTAQQPARKSRRRSGRWVSITTGVVIGTTAAFLSRIGKNSVPDAPPQVAQPAAVQPADTASAFDALSAEDKAMVEWHVAELRRVDRHPHYREFSNADIAKKVARSPKMMRQIKWDYTHRQPQKPQSAADGQGVMLSDVPAPDDVENTKPDSKKPPHTLEEIPPERRKPSFPRIKTMVPKVAERKADEGFSRG